MWVRRWDDSRIQGLSHVLPIQVYYYIQYVPIVYGQDPPLSRLREYLTPYIRRPQGTVRIMGYR